MICNWLLVLFVGLGLLGCKSSSVVELKDSSVGCTGVLPVSALNHKDINVELANLIVQQVALGNFQVKYTETMEALLSDAVLDRWVKEEMFCQGSKTFEIPEQKIWFLTMKEISEKASAQEFLLWLKENPINKFSELIQELEGEVKIEYVSGKIILPHNLKLAEVDTLFSNGELNVPGPTTILINYCSGLVRHHPKAKIIIKSAFSSCVQEELEK